MPLPKGPNGEEPCTPKGMGLTPNLTFEAYVVELLKKRRAGQYTPNGSAPSAAGAGACGSGGGLPAPNEPAEDDPDGRDDVDQDVSNQAASEAIDKHQRAKGKGSVPAGLARHAQAALEPAKVDWREVVRRAVCSVVEVRAGLAEYSRRRISRRQWGVGIDDDAPVLPGMVAARAEVAVVADTSGSMWGALEEAWGEVAGLLDAIDGAQVTYVACDAKVHAVLKTSSIEEVKQHTKGGGGTDFRPAFRELDERKADLIVFITDGYGDYPDEVPAADVLWVVVPGGEISVDWGERVAISADGRT
jgi:predicted metal-dependent peptidase